MHIAMAVNLELLLFVPLRRKLQPSPKGANDPTHQSAIGVGVQNAIAMEVAIAMENAIAMKVAIGMEVAITMEVASGAHLAPYRREVHLAIGRSHLCRRPPCSQRASRLRTF